MKFIEQYWEYVFDPDYEKMCKFIEIAARTCYKSESNITNESAEKMVAKLIRDEHNAMIEFAPDIVIRCVTNRGISHELVRHRHCSFAQESTRYVDYKKKPMEFIKPIWWDDPKYTNEARKNIFMDSCKNAESDYLNLRRLGDTPQQAREILPNALKTEILIKANIREWMHILNLRCSLKAHPQMVVLMRSVLADFYLNMPVIFGFLAGKYLSVDDYEHITAQINKGVGK